MRAWPLFGALLCACAPPEASPPELASTAQAIVGGAEAPNDAAVFYLRVTRTDGATAGCTGTLIGKRTLLTAAHCLRGLVSTPADAVKATNALDVAMAAPSEWIAAADYLAYPNSTDLAHDIGLVLLESEPGVAPKAWNTMEVSGLTGKPLRAVGYGVTSYTGGGSGVRRTVDLYFTNTTPSTIRLGDQVSRGVCFGDSGGPSFHVFPDGLERLVGVHSKTASVSCTDGDDVRVDPPENAEFIEGYLTLKEGIQCGNDGRCNRACGADPDCLKDGEGCFDFQQCFGKRCIIDPQRAGTYCSHTCTLDTDCAAPMTCGISVYACWKPQLPTMKLGERCIAGVNVCAPGNLCTGFAGLPQLCEVPCGDGCRGGKICVEGTGGEFCAHEPVSMPLLGEETSRARGCEAGAGGALLWLAACVARSLLRRR